MELTNKEKKEIAILHAKEIMINMRNLEASIFKENLVDVPNQNLIEDMRLKISEYQSKFEAITSEINTLEEAISN